MKELLITGANGFLGSRLKEKLQHEYKIYEYTRNTDDSYLQKISNLYGIIHLAGEVRPDATKEDFYCSNELLTQKIVEVGKSANSEKFIFASSVHAKFKKNQYGISKNNSESFLFSIFNDNSKFYDIIRFPHLYGPNIKANYNSAIATWINKLIKGESIQIYDDDYLMHYLHVDDACDFIINSLETEVTSLFRISEVEKSLCESITLGDLAKLLKYIIEKNEVKFSDDLYCSEKFFNNVLNMVRSYQ